MLYAITGQDKDKTLGVARDVGPSVGTRALSIYIKDQDHQMRPDRVNLALRQFVFMLPLSRTFHALTVTGGSCLYTKEQFDLYGQLARNRPSLQMIYLPRKHICPLDNPGEVAQVSLWIQRDAPPALYTSTTPRKPDLFLENSTLLAPARELAGDLRNVHGLSFFGGDDSGVFSVSNLCRSMGIQDGTNTTSLRFTNMDIVHSHRLSNLSNLAALDLHDIKKPDKVLDAASDHATQLKRLTVAYSGYANFAKLAKFKDKIGASLYRLVRNNGRMKELCIYVQDVQWHTPEDIIAVLPTTLEHLTIIKGSSDFFRPEHYAPVAARCRRLRGMGTTMHFAAASDTRSIESFSRANIATMVVSKTVKMYLTQLT